MKISILVWNEQCSIILRIIAGYKLHSVFSLSAREMKSAVEFWRPGMCSAEIQVRFAMQYFWTYWASTLHVKGTFPPFDGLCNAILVCWIDDLRLFRLSPKRYVWAGYTLFVRLSSNLCFASCRLRWFISRVDNVKRANESNINFSTSRQFALSCSNLSLLLKRAYKALVMWRRIFCIKISILLSLAVFNLKLIGLL